MSRLNFGNFEMTYLNVWIYMGRRKGPDTQLYPWMTLTHIINKISQWNKNSAQSISNVLRSVKKKQSKTALILMTSKSNIGSHRFFLFGLIFWKPNKKCGLHAQIQNIFIGKSICAASVCVCVCVGRGGQDKYTLLRRPPPTPSTSLV